jgi:CheY-like chemotaxis protein
MTLISIIIDRQQGTIELRYHSIISENPKTDLTEPMAKEIEKVLLVDDDQNIRLVAQMALEGLTNWKILLADSGAQALKIALAEKPDLVILDMMMPSMDGPTTFAKLLEQGSLAQTPVIFMTAKVQKHEVEDHLKLGAAGVIAKPFDPMLLPDEIRKIVERAANPETA